MTTVSWFGRFPRDKSENPEVKCCAENLIFIQLCWSVRRFHNYLFLFGNQYVESEACYNLCPQHTSQRARQPIRRPELLNKRCSESAHRKSNDSDLNVGVYIKSRSNENLEFFLRVVLACGRWPQTVFTSTPSALLVSPVSAACQPCPSPFRSPCPEAAAHGSCTPAHLGSARAHTRLRGVTHKVLKNILICSYFLLLHNKRLPAHRHAGFYCEVATCQGFICSPWDGQQQLKRLFGASAAFQ